MTPAMGLILYLTVIGLVFLVITAKFVYDMLWISFTYPYKNPSPLDKKIFKLLGFTDD